MTGGSRESKPLIVSDPGRLTLLAHDVRATMAEVHSAISNLETSPRSAVVSDEVRHLRLTTELLGRLLEEALFVIIGQKLEGRDLSETVNLKKVLDAFHSRWARIAAAQNADFKLTIDPQVPVFSVVDHLSIERVLSNFLTNALRHGGDRITLTLSSRDDNWLVFSVSDNGPGFDKDRIDDLFKFKGTPFGFGQPGSGFGLRIAQEAAHRMNGEVHAGNGPDGGAHVVLSLPPTRIGTLPEPINMRTIRQDFGGKCALIAEDSEANRMLMRDLLASAGVEVIEAADGLAAREALDQGGIDFMLVDVEMPYLSGPEVILGQREKEAEHGLDRLPILAVTAYAFDANRADIMDSGADDILIKPLRNRSAFYRALYGVTNLDLPSMLIHRAGDIATPRTMVNALSDLSATLGEADLAAFFAALERDLVAQSTALHLAMDSVAPEGIERAAHVLSGLFSTIGAMREHRFAQQVSRDIETYTTMETMAAAMRLKKDADALKDVIARHAPME